MSVEFDFSDSVALVTGAGGALGSAIATGFAESGATVAAVDIVEPESEDFLLDPDHDLIERIASDLSVDPSFVEKDWHAMRLVAVVASVTATDVTPVFSGGTSLKRREGCAAVIAQPRQRGCHAEAGRMTV